MATFEQAITAIKQGLIASRDDGLGPAFVFLQNGILGAWVWGKGDENAADEPPFWIQCDLLDLESHWVLSVDDIMSDDWAVLTPSQSYELSRAVFFGFAPPADCTT